MTIISKIQALPTSPFQDTNVVGIVITNGIPSFFRVIGSNLDDIVSVNWYPANPASVLFEVQQLMLLDHTEGTFMIRVSNNYLDTDNRGGKLSFQLKDGSVISMPVITYGPVSVGPLWQSPNTGLITG